jgi:adenosylhomocysteine nucleosidase
VLTGDRFVTDPDLRADLRERFDGTCVEMEGASVTLVCSVNNVPCVLIRTISDHADGTVDFQHAMSSGAVNARHYVTSIVTMLKESR